MEYFDDLMKEQGLVNEYWYTYSTETCGQPAWLKDNMGHKHMNRIDYGCMLGALRHGRLIPWDHDLDVGITTAGYEKCMALMRVSILLTLCVS
jgi:hypothetical protein